MIITQTPTIVLKSSQVNFSDQCKLTLSEDELVLFIWVIMHDKQILYLLLIISWQCLNQYIYLTIILVIIGGAYLLDHASITTGEWLLTHVSRAAWTVIYLIASLATPIITPLIMLSYLLFILPHLYFMQIWKILAEVATRILTASNRLKLFMLRAFWKINTQLIEVLFKFWFLLIYKDIWCLFKFHALWLVELAESEKRLSKAAWSSTNVLLHSRNGRDSTSSWIIDGLVELIPFLMIHAQLFSY